MLRSPYIPGAPLVARVAFKFNGTAFLPGKPFDKAEEAGERRCRQMWDCRMVECVPEGAALPKTIPHLQPTKVQAPSHGAPDGTYRAEHRGFGRWEVVEKATGAVVFKGGKDDAATEASRLNETRRGAGDPAPGDGDRLPTTPGAGSAPHVA